MGKNWKNGGNLSELSGSELLDRAASSPADVTELEWYVLLVQHLNLDESCRAIVCKILDEGRWRMVKQPMAYVQRAVRRQLYGVRFAEAPSISDLPRPGSMSYDDKFDALAFKSRENRSGPKTNIFDFLPDDLVKTDGKPDWNRISKKLRLDEDERKLLQWRLDGGSRDAAAKELGWDEKRVGAAWKRLFRSLGKLKESARNPDDDYFRDDET